MANLMKAVAALVCIAAACGPRLAPASMTACIPPGTIAAAAIDLDRVRAAPLYSSLPVTVRMLAEASRTAHQVLVAWNGDDVLFVFQGVAPGATTIGPNLAAIGTPEAIRAASAQFRAGKPGAPGLAGYAARNGGGSPVWAVVQGGITLPLTGNSRNLNLLLRNLEYAALAGDLTASLDLRLTALGRNEQAAREFEENLRGILSLTSAAEARRPQIAALLRSVQVRRSGATTTVSVRVPPDMIETLAEPFL